MLCVFDRLVPSGFADVPYGREVLFVDQLYSHATDARQNRTIPGGNVQNEFPDAVRVRYGMGFGHLGIDALEQFKKRVAMPGLSIKGTAYLVGKTGGFGHAALLEVYVFKIVRQSSLPQWRCPPHLRR